MKGQVEMSFQWLFVLIAGAVLLFLLFSIFQGMTARTEERVRGLAVETAARTFETAIWQPHSTFNMTLDGMTVACPAGELSLMSEKASAGLERVPVFLPPTLEGRLQVNSKEVVLPGGVGPSLPLGNVLYGLSEGVFVLLIQDTSVFPLTSYVTPHENIRVLPADGLADPTVLRALVPPTAKVVVLVSQNEPGYVTNADTSLLAGEIKGVVLGLRDVTFYERRDGRMVLTSTEPAELPELKAGAIVATSPETYACGREAFTQRLRRLLDVLRIRAGNLRLTGACEQTFTVVRRLLTSATEDFPTSFFLNDDQLVRLQEALFRQSCPVIA